MTVRVGCDVLGPVNGMSRGREKVEKVIVLS